jgi:hypothetical protein
MNTKNKGQISLLILENPKAKRYLGIVYELAIVLESDSLEQLKTDLIEASKGYVETVRKKELPDYLLYKPDQLPTEYKQLYDEFENRFLKKEKPTKLSEEYEDAFQNAHVNLSVACV